MNVEFCVLVQDGSIQLILSRPVSGLEFTPEEAKALAETILQAVEKSKAEPSSYSECKQAILKEDAESPGSNACQDCGTLTSCWSEEPDGQLVSLCFNCYEKRSLHIWQEFIEGVMQSIGDARMINLEGRFPVSEAPANGLYCPVCGEPQFFSPKGVFCINLHQEKGVFGESEEK